MRFIDMRHTHTIATSSCAAQGGCERSAQRPENPGNFLFVLELDPEKPGEWNRTVKESAEKFRKFLRSKEMREFLKSDPVYKNMGGSKLRICWLELLIEMRVERFLNSGREMVDFLQCENCSPPPLVFGIDGQTFWPEQFKKRTGDIRKERCNDVD